MAGMQFEYDEKGDKVWYFILSVYAICLLPLTYYFWPSKKLVKKEEHPEEISKFPPCVEKCKALQSNEPRKFERLYSIVLLCALWLLFGYFLFKVLTIQHETNEYDPYSVLQIDRGASVNEIKSAYRSLSKLHHPDKGGDAVIFQKIILAYKALTDNETRSNWEKYGNPDGPGVTHFGIALPKWIVEEKNSALVLGVYILLFIVILPVGVSSWWYKSIKFTSDSLLVDTSHIFSVFLMKTPCMNIKRIIMVLSGALEFEKSHNSKIVEHPEDETEVPRLLKEFSFLKENCREKPLCFPYSVKARVLIHAYMARAKLQLEYLKRDQDYVVKLCPFLLNEMIQIAVQLITFYNMGQLPRSPNLSTLENIMKLSQLMIQGFDEKKSPFLQLPYITDHNLRLFSSRHMSISSLKKLAALPDSDRRSLLRSLSDEQYSDLVMVLGSMPLVSMKVKTEVVDDDNSHIITSGSLVTLTVTLSRNVLSSLFGSSLSSLDGESSSEKLSLSNSNNSKTSLSNAFKRNVKASTPTPQNDATKRVSEGGELGNNEEDSSSDEDDILDKFKEEQRKRERMDNKPKVSHRVFCPYYPSIKYECWWLYVVDRKSHNIVAAPVHVTSLRECLELDIKFTAPTKVGSYIYSVILRSDSYLDLDVINELKLFVHATPSVVAEPMWESCSEAEEKSASSKSNEDEFTTESSDDE